jgi:c-di-AMP phosphodiesterase-like protein
METGMKEKKTKRIKVKGKLKNYLRWPIVMNLVLMAVVVWVFFVDVKVACVMLGVTAITTIASIVLYALHSPILFKDVVDFASDYGRLQKRILRELELPYGIMDDGGKLLWVNEQFADVLGDGSKRNMVGKSIYTVFPELPEDVLEELEEDYELRTDRDKQAYYRISLKKLNIGDAFENSSVLEMSKEASLIAVTVFDETEVRLLEREFANEKMVVGQIYIDNYEEALTSVESVRQSLLIALIDRKINKYFASIDGIVRKVEKDKYFIAVKNRYVGTLQSNKFAILDEVKGVNIGNSMAITISIGLGVGGKTYQEQCEFSRAAMDLALGRGGDQAVIKNGEKVYYYGGKSRSVEKNNRVKARMKAHALQELVMPKSQVLIMGHKLADVDAFGSAIGLYCAMRAIEKETHIVINDITTSLRPVYDSFAGNPDYPEDLFISGQEARERIDEDTIVIVVDVNRPTYTECPELLSASKATVVLDHHRQSSEHIEKAVLSYIEPYASSACEMTSEILQYFADGVRINQHEADTIYAGIILDTNNFTNKTGVRTFEAAAFLKKCGADVVRVRKLFRDSEVEYRSKAEAISSTEIMEGGFAIAISPSEGLESPTIVAAQAANELLNMKNVRGSFVLTQFQNKVYISARSIDEINVQLIMERMGGGGHMNVAGAQLEGASLADAKELLKETIRGMVADGDI